MRLAAGRRVRACFVRSSCSVLLSKMTCATPVHCNSKQRLSSHFTLRSSHFTLDTSSHLRSCELFSPHLTSSQLFSSHPIASHMSSKKVLLNCFHLIRALINLSHLLEFVLNSSQLFCTPESSYCLSTQKLETQMHVWGCSTLYGTFAILPSLWWNFLVTWLSLQGGAQVTLVVAYPNEFFHVTILL